MGFVMSKVWEMFASHGEVKVILVGLDNAGKEKQKKRKEKKKTKKKTKEEGKGARGETVLRERSRENNYFVQAAAERSCRDSSYHWIQCRRSSV